MTHHPNETPEPPAQEQAGEMPVLIALPVVAHGFFGPWKERNKLDWRPRNKLWEPLVKLSAATAALQAKDAEIARMKANAERTARNRDMWKGQCERQAEQLTEFRTKGGPHADQA